MNDRMTLGVKCHDALKDNGHWYAIKARRKKIALIRIEVSNPQSAEVQVRLGSTKLTAGGKMFATESPAVILRKLSEFTWDFLLYSLLDFHPVTAVIEVCVWLTGPLYNRRLRRQLALLFRSGHVAAAGRVEDGDRGIPRRFAGNGTAHNRVSLW